MDNKTRRVNGKFKLFYRKGWAYLTVYPPEGKGKDVYPEDIENRMKLMGMPKVPSKIIRDTIEKAGENRMDASDYTDDTADEINAAGTTVALAEWPGGQQLEARIDIHLSDDAMQAEVEIQKPKKGAAEPDYADIIEALHDTGVYYGIDEQRIKDVLKRRLWNSRFIAAQGTRAVLGRGYRISYLFNRNRGKPYLEMNFGRINLKELNFIENKKSGDLLAELIPPVKAVDGRKVTGEIIPAETDRELVELHGGANTRLSEDRRRLYAECDGNVRIQDGRILVEPLITVKNVNYETGNIRFDGSVVVEGSIADGFIVEAGGTIQVANGVGRATLKAGGNILLKTGINGNGEGSIRCGGDLFAKYVESCSVRCGNNVLVEEAIMHSDIQVTGHCILNGRRSEVLASKLLVGGSFWCKKLGNVYETPTTVHIGVQPELLTAYREAAGSLVQKQEEWDKTEYQLEQVVKLIQDGRQDSKILQVQRQLQTQLDSLKTELSEIRKRVPALKEKIQASKDSLAVIEESMYKGAVITFGNLDFRPPDAGIRKIILRAADNKIIDSAFNYHERPQLNFAKEAEEEEKNQDNV